MSLSPSVQAMNMLVMSLEVECRDCQPKSGLDQATHGQPNVDDYISASMQVAPSRTHHRGKMRSHRGKIQVCWFQGKDKSTTGLASH